MLKPDCILLYGDHGYPLSKYAGTFRISTELRNHGYNVQCIDISAFDKFDDSLKELIDNLISPKTLWLGISTTFLHHFMGYPYFKTIKNKENTHAKTPNIDSDLKKFVKYIKDKNPNIQLITGGSRKFMIEEYGFKIFSFYSDKEIVEFTNWCKGVNSTPSLSFYTNNIPGSEYQNFTESKIIYHENDIVNPNTVLPIEISRGCIFKCKFCSFPMNGKSKGDWIKTSRPLLDEFRKNYEYFGVTDYIFSDDTYNDSEAKVKSLYDDVYSKLDFKINFTTYIRLDLLMRFPDTLDYLKESGLVSALFGIETINKESGVAIGKGLDPKTQFEFVKEIKKNQFKNILTHSGFIIGLPKDRPTEMSLLEEFLFSDDNQLDHVSVDPLFLMPPISASDDRKNYSTFDIEHEKYGYKCWETDSAMFRNGIKWRNDIIKMTFDQASAFSAKITQKINESDKFKYAGFAFAYFKSLGIPAEDLMTLSKRQINQKYNLKQIILDKKAVYKSTLRDIVLGNRLNITGLVR